MPTTFIAVQCFECSTMQVKQQKKSSNKWSCVVCNQKQSVRKVFAQAFMAKDVRKFVQNFNMCRQLSDQNQLLSEEIQTVDFPEDEQKRKRNDWTEYLDGQEEYCGKFDRDGNLAEEDKGLEPMVVTEMPKALFKKPKVKDYSFGGYGAKKLMKPQFPNSSSAKKHNNTHSQDVKLTKLEQTSCQRATKRSDCTIQIRVEDSFFHEGPMSLNPSEASKWNSSGAKIQDDYSSLANREKPFLHEPTKGVKDENNAFAEPTVRLPHKKGPVSKWSSYMSEEDDDNLACRGSRDSWDRVSSKWGSCPLGSLINDERVEDDIHPDFL